MSLSIGSGNFVGSNSPVFISPTLGVASATSITFGQTILSAYAESQSWTPAITFATPGDVSVTYATQTGVYYVIGKLVFVAWNLTFTPTYTTASGKLTLTGLPLVVTNNPGGITAGIISNTSSGITYTVGRKSFKAFPNPLASTITFEFFGSAIATSFITTTNLVSGVALTINGGSVYLTS